MTNIVMIVRDRPRLTEQALYSLWKNTKSDEYNLTVVDDGSKPPITLPPYRNVMSHITVRLSEPVGIIGFLRNLGVSVAQKHFGRGDWLYFSDNDVYFKPGWLERMTGTLAVNHLLSVLGGVRHPYHQPNRWHREHLPQSATDSLLPNPGWDEVDAVAGYSMLMRWGTWDTYGPFDAHAKGVGQSEDWALCRKVVEADYRVGYIHPPVLVNCGLTNTLGEKVPGWEQFEIVEGVVQE